jgi:hypothetical protein
MEKQESILVEMSKKYFDRLRIEREDRAKWHETNKPTAIVIKMNSRKKKQSA